LQPGRFSLEDDPFLFAVTLADDVGAVIFAVAEVLHGLGMVRDPVLASRSDAPV
jgi:hypothetical protein